MFTANVYSYRFNFSALVLNLNGESLDAKNHLRFITLYKSFFFLTVISSVASGLEITSSIRGDVTEAGSAVSSATVIVRNENTGRERSVTTNESGSFWLEICRWMESIL